jgi:hypothetical protein
VCRAADVKAAIGALRGTLARAYEGRYASITVVGVAINTDLREGLAYLNSIGLDHFDEITTGRGWQNGEVIRWIQRGQAAPAAVPLIVVVTRTMTASIAPLAIVYSPDSVLAVVQGRAALVEWIQTNAPLPRAPEVAE